jgi:hypothetical protein
MAFTCGGYAPSPSPARPQDENNTTESNPKRDAVDEAVPRVWDDASIFFAFQHYPAQAANLFGAARSCGS